MANILTEIYKASPNIQKAGGKKMVKKTAAKKTTAKKPVAKKPAAKKPAAKKTTAPKKTPAKKTASKKSTAKKSSVKKSAVKKTPAKKSVTKNKTNRLTGPGGTKPHCPPGCVKKPVKKNQKGGGEKSINLQQAVQVLRDYYNNK